MGDTRVSRYTPRDAVHVIGLIEPCAQFLHNQTNEKWICLLRPLCVCVFFWGMGITIYWVTLRNIFRNYHFVRSSIQILQTWSFFVPFLLGLMQLGGERVWLW